MTFRESLTVADAMLRLRGWKRRQEHLTYEQQQRAEHWKHRAITEAARAGELEHRARRLQRRVDLLERQLRERS